MSQRALACPKCGMKLTAPEGADRFRCPRCKTVLTAPSSAEPEDPFIGTEVGGYQVTRLIGEGGMGTVYEAIQAGLKRRVALKVLPPEATANVTFLTSFKREAQAAAKLNHPNIIQIFDIVEDRGRHFFSMELVDGENLATRLEREGRLAVPDALGIVAQVAAALDYAYERLLIHRDIKPSNILLTQRGHVKVVDLGLSKSLEDTAVGLVRGSHGGPIYMAPELARNPQLADCRSDIYALGAVLFHLITGQQPFPGPTVGELLDQHAQDPFPSAKALRPDIPKPVDDLIQKMCAKDPVDRVQTHRELLDELRVLLKRTAIRVPKVADAAPIRAKRRSKHWLAWSLAGLGAAVAVGVAAILLLPLLRARPAKAEAPGAAAVETPEPEKPAPEASPEAQPAAPEKQPTPPPETVVEVPAPPAPEPPQVPEVKKEEPAKPPEPPPWEARLAQAKARADDLAKQKRFGDAVAALEALAEADKGNADLMKAVDEATEALRRDGAAAFDKARAAAAALASQGKLAEAKAALQQVADTCGMEEEVRLAREGVAALGLHAQAQATLGQAAQAASAQAQAAERHAAALAALAKAVEPASQLLADWKLAEARDALAKVQAEDAAAAKLLDAQRASLDGLIDLRDRMIQAVKTAEPRLRKSDLRIVGLNGDLVDADDQAITIQTQVKAEKLPWSQLREVSINALASRTAKQDGAGHKPAVELYLQLVGEGGKPFAEVAEAATKAAREAKAARALAAALRPPEESLLKEYQKDFGDTQWFADHEEAFKAAVAFKPLSLPARGQEPSEGPATPAPKPVKPKTPPTPAPPRTPVAPGAVSLYDKAVEAFRTRHYAEAGARLDELKAMFPDTPLLADATRKPSVGEMLQVIGARGPLIKVGAKGDGAVRTLQEAVDALTKPSSTIELEAGTHRGGANVPGRNANSLVVRGAGHEATVLDGGSPGKTRALINFLTDCKDVWVEGIELTRAEAGIVVGMRSSATIRKCVALNGVGVGLKKEPKDSVTISRSALRIGSLGKVTADGSAFECEDEAAIDSSTFTGCVLNGPNTLLEGVTLTDCLILGAATLQSDAKLSHCTVIGPLLVPAGVRGIEITDSILEALDVAPPDPKDKKPEAAVSLARVFLFRQSRPWPKGAVKAEETDARGKVDFLNPRAGDFRLAADSPLLAKDGGKDAPGCRFPAEMLEVLKLGRRYPALLKPAAPSHKHKR